MVSSLSVAELLDPFRSHPESAAVFSDYDGTLAPIVDDPATAVPLPGVVEALAGLARRYRLVGVVSGRPAAFLRAHLGGHGLFLSGLYGMEAVEGDEVVVDPEADRWRPVVEDVAARGDAELAGPSVERKGLSVVVHFRTDPAQESAARAWAAAEAGRSGLVVHPGRMSFELRPPLEVDKGRVVAAHAGDGGPVCFVGDDRGDLPVFDALDRAAAEHGTHVLRVAVGSPEAPPELLQRADLVVDGPEGVLSFLRDLLTSP